MAAEPGRIGRYRLERLLARTDLSEVYLGRDEDGQAVCVKRPRPGSAAAGGAAALTFKHEARLLAEARHPAVVRALEVGEHEGLPFICLELVEGPTLEARAREGHLAAPAALGLLRQIAEAIAHVHARGLVHGDLKPANVLLSGPAEAPRIKLVDFGLARAAGARREGREGIEGTPHYMAPEQTGLVDWPVDGRADLYALGVIAFELLAGQLPFPDEDPAALLAAHAGRPPPRLLEARPELPPILELIVQKLLEKDPARRYRSARSLAHDLGLLAERLRAGDPSPTFVIDAVADPTERVGQVFVGRDEELDELTALCARVGQGRPAAAFIGGPAGVGKSALLHELTRRTIAGGARFAAGKCYEFARALPYHVFAQALTDHLARLEGAPAAVREAAHRRAREAVGELGAELVKIAPAFARVLPDAGEPVYLGEGRDRVRFLGVLTRLFEALAPPGSPLLLLLDDLQWADAGSLAALEALVDGVRDASLLLLGTFRAEEVGEDHPLRKTLDRARRAGGRVVDLRPFDARGTALLIAESLRQPVSALDPALVDRVFQRTGGNPLFVAEVLKALLASGALRVEAGQLRTDIERLEATELPSTIVDVVLRRAQELDAPTRRALGTAALIGTGSSLELVAAAADLAPEQAFEALEAGVAARILRPAREGRYRFDHDRMQEACARLVDEAERPAIHARIVRHLERDAGEGAPDEVVFALAEHARLAGDPARAARHGRAAAERARARHESQQALSYYRQALAHAAAGGVAEADRRAMRERVAELLTLLGRYDEAHAAWEELLAEPDLAPARRARLLSLLGGCKQRAGDHAAARDALTGALHLLGLSPPERPSAWALAAARLRWLVARLRAAISGPIAADERRAVVLDALIRLWLLLFVTDTRRVPLISYLLLAEAEPLGPSRELSRALRHLTVALAQLPRPAWRAAVRHGERAVAIARRIGEPLEAGIAALYTSDIFVWSARWREALPWLETARETLSALGNMWELANAHIFSYMAYRGAGRLDEAMAHAQALLELGERLGAAGTIANANQKVAEILLLRGDTARAESHLQTGVELAEARKLRFERFQGYKIQGLGLLLAGRLAEARARFEAAIKLCESPGVSFFQGYLSDAYLGHAEAFLKDGDYFAAAGGLAGEEGRRAARYVAQRLARERHLLGHLGHAHRVRGLLLWRAGRPAASRRAFLRAAAVLTAQERPVEVALTWIDAAAALGAHTPEEAHAWLRRARATAERLRLKPLLARCDEILRELGHEVAAAAPAAAASEKALRALRELTEVSQLLMQARDPELLLERIADSSLSLLGAERAFVFLRREGRRELAFRLGKSADGRRVSEEEANVSRGVIDRVDSSGEGLAVSDTEQDHTLRERRSVQAYQVRSVLCAPLLTASRPLGVLYLDSQITKAIFGRPELELLQSFAAQAAAALANAVHLATVERMNRELDAKVLERTRALEGANLKLEASMAELKNTTLRLAEAKREALEKELEVARRIQLAMVPERRAHEAPAARFVGVVEPASLCGGDIWTFAEADEEKLVLFIGDVTGHGAGAAMITTVAKSCIDTLWLEHGGGLALERLCATLNAVIKRLGRGELLMTAFAVEIDPARRLLTYCSAGHNPQLLLRGGPGGAELAPLFERGVRLGDGVAQDFTVKSRPYAPGDKLILYTDGLVDRADAAGSEYGMRRLQRLLRGRAALGPEELFEAILADAGAHAGGEPAQDDLTLVVAELR